MKGKLILVPTPIAPGVMISQEIKKGLEDAFQRGDLLLVEEHKIARRRWIAWGLPREAIDQFICYNEHNQQEEITQVIQQIQKGRNAYIMSDGGLPAFCDPGQLLVHRCHESQIQVSSLPFSNSVILAIALSGFCAKQFIFQGFLPQKTQERNETWKRMQENSSMQVFMDTPYRLIKCLEELQEFCPERDLFMGCDLNSDIELCVRGKPSQVMKKLQGSKREFIGVMASRA